MNLVDNYIYWHAFDIYDWHLLTGNVAQMHASCARLGAITKTSIPTQKKTKYSEIETTTKNTNNKRSTENSLLFEDPIFKIIQNSFN